MQLYGPPAAQLPYEQKGFNVLAWESDFMEAHFMEAHFTATPGRAADTYCLGFLSATGSSRRVQAAQPTPLVPSRRGYFETWLPVQLPYGFVDFRAFWAQQPGYAASLSRQGLGYEGGRGYTDQDAWTTIFDGIFFIREMQPCGKSSFVAPAAAGN